MKRYKYRKIWACLMAFLLAFLPLLSGCAEWRDTGTEQARQPSTDEESQPQETQPAAETETLPEEPEEPEPENTVVTFTAAGDNLIHNTLSFDSRQDDGSYDFTHIYAGIRDEIAGSDVALYTQEVPLDDTVGAYPTLSAPKSVAAAMADLGFTAASLANNHMADKGAEGARQTIAALEENGIAAVGARDDESEVGSYVVLEVKGVRIGLLAYTYGLNAGLGGSDWMVDRISTQKITEDVAALRPQCDFLAVAMHWGTEYQQTPSDGQREFAALLSSLGVDLIIGSHPHVLQPAQWIDREAGMEPTLCIYSMGNFVSGQREQDRLLGGLLRLELEFSPEGRFIGFKSAAIDGVVTHYERGNKGFRLYMLEDYTEELAARHGLHDYDLPFTLDFLTQRMAGMEASLAR